MNELIKNGTYTEEEWHQIKIRSRQRFYHRYFSTKPVGPYPLCFTPESCSKVGYCLRDPNCGD